MGLCRLPEAQLLKLQLPQPLLSAISIWKMRQSGVSGGGVGEERRGEGRGRMGEGGVGKRGGEGRGRRG